MVEHKLYQNTDLIKIFEWYQGYSYLFGLESSTVAYDKCVFLMADPVRQPGIFTWEPTECEKLLLVNDKDSISEASVGVNTSAGVTLGFVAGLRSMGMWIKIWYQTKGWLKDHEREGSGYRSIYLHCSYQIYLNRRTKVNLLTYPLVGCRIRNEWLILKTQKFIYQSKTNWDKNNVFW